MKTREDYIDEWTDDVRDRRNTFFNRFYHAMTDGTHIIDLGYLYDLELSRMIWAARNELVSFGYASRDAEDLLLYGYKSIDTVLDIRSTEKVIRSAGINRTIAKALLSDGAKGLSMSPDGSYRVTTAVDRETVLATAEELSTKREHRKATQAEIGLAVRETQAAAVSSGEITYAELVQVIPVNKRSDYNDEVKRAVVVLLADQGYMSHRVCHALVNSGQRPFRYKRFYVNNAGLIVSHRDIANS